MNLKNTNYTCGIGKEKTVANKYKRNGASGVVQSPGSRGAADLKVSLPARKDHFVQVKSTCDPNGKPKPVTKTELARLINKADSHGGVAVVAYVQANGRSDLRYAKTGQKVRF